MNAAMIFRQKTRGIRITLTKSRIIYTSGFQPFCTPSLHFVFTKDSRPPPLYGFIEINLAFRTHVYYFYNQQLAEEKQGRRTDNLISYATCTTIMYYYVPD
jgi:hypothetical protein